MAEKQPQYVNILRQPFDDYAAKFSYSPLEKYSDMINVELYSIALHRFEIRSDTNSYKVRYLPPVR